MKSLRLAPIVTTLALCYVSPALAQEAAGVENCPVAYARGQEERLAGRLYNARGAFQQCASDACSPELVRDCRRWLSEVEADLPTARISVRDPRGAPIDQLSITIDGQALAPSALSAPIVLEAGPHELRFEAPGYEPVRLEKALRPSDREVSVAVTLRPPAPAPAPLEKPAGKVIPPASWAMAGVGALALGTSLYFGIKAKSEYKQLQEACSPDCSPASVKPVKDHAFISDVALGGSLLAFAAAVAVYLIDDSPSTSASRRSGPRSFSLNGDVNPRGGRVGVQLSF